MKKPRISLTPPPREKPKPEEIQPLQLSLPGLEERSFVPNDYVRSALFSVVRRGRRRYLEEVTIAAWKGVEIEYTGKQLDQADLDVLMAVARMAAESEDGVVRVSRRALLRALGRAWGSKNWSWLRSSLIRMTACDLAIYKGGYEYHGNILHWARDEEEDELVIILNRYQRWLWEPRSLTALDIPARRALKSDLAKWMQGYVCSHSTKDGPHKVSLKKLKPLTGSTAKMFKFRQTLRQAMDALQKLGIVKEWSLEGDILSFRRP